jgi:uncharacterized membrane protein (DUF2068 family)
MNRPTGVTILAVLSFCGVFLAILLACGFLFGSAVSAALGMPLIGASSVVAAALCFAGAVLAVFNGIGLLRLQNWARILTIVLTGLSLLGAVLGILNGVFHFRIFLTFRELIVAAIDLLVLRYLFRPEIKSAFGTVGF